MLKLENISFTYDQGFSLQLDNFELSEGKNCFIIGKSGSGKSSLLRLISAELKAQSGSIQFNGKDITKLDEPSARQLRLEEIITVRQDLGLLEYINVFENIVLPCRLHPKFSIDQSSREKASELLKAMDLAGYEKRMISELSQGEKQRVAICRALILQPKLLLADEITSSLDPKTSKLIVELLLKLAKEQGFSIIMVSHDHSFKEQFDQVLDFDLLREEKNV